MSNRAFLLSCAAYVIITVAGMCVGVVLSAVWWGRF